MYIDSEPCFVVFDFLQILYVSFTLINYMNCCITNLLLYLFQLIRLFLSHSLLYNSKIVKIQPIISRLESRDDNQCFLFFEKRNHKVSLHWRDFQVRRIFRWLDVLMEIVQIKPTAITLVAAGSKQVRKDREVISSIYRSRARKQRRHGAREKDICRFPVPFRCPAVTMPRSNCSLFSDRTLPRRSTRR